MSLELQISELNATIKTLNENILLLLGSKEQHSKVECSPVEPANLGQTEQQTFLPIGENNAKEIHGAKIVFADINSVPGVLVSIKNNPSIPLTFVTIFLFSIGMILVILRIISRTVNT